MNDVFLITSALGVNYGIYNVHQRFSQLCETINSIRKYNPTSDIYIVDSGVEPPPDEYIKILSGMVNYFVTIGDHPFIRSSIDLPKDSNYFIPKTLGEIGAMMEFLHQIKNRGIQYSRVYKISGRYKLNANYDPSIHTKSKNSVVVREHQQWYDSVVYVTRLWSFDYILLDKMIEVFKGAISQIIEIYQRDVQIPIPERLLYDNLTKFNVPVVEVGVIGVEGLFGQDGAPIND